MDPFTQGTLGAALSQATRKNTAHVRVAGGFGFLSGLTADLDVLIRSSTDPLIFLEYHRQFTHSFVFIPIGGLLCALILHRLWGKRWQLSFLHTFIFCTLGYATHALLDACTSYGTMLLWPISDERFSWSIISIIDPLFTLPLALLIATSVWRRRPLYAQLGLAWAAAYLTLGFMQHNAALTMGQQLAISRGHTPMRLEVKPSFANLLVWKTIYETPDSFYVDAVRAGLGPRTFEGVSVPKLNLARDVPWLDATSQQAKDISRFRFFSDGFVALDPTRPNHIMDVRYSFVPNEISPLWSIELFPAAPLTTHAQYRTHRENPREDTARLLQMLSAPE